jgi:hypothetical protein
MLYQFIINCFNGKTEYSKALIYNFKKYLCAHLLNRNEYHGNNERVILLISFINQLHLFQFVNTFLTKEYHQLMIIN